MTAEISYVYAALLDVIGYKYRLSKDRETATLDFKDSLQRAMAVFNDINEADYSHQAISDTVIITCSNYDKLVEFFDVLSEVMIGFLAEGLFVRGGLTYSQHFKSAHVTYSHALARAHEIESQTAIYPRVVIDHNIVEMFQTAGELGILVVSNRICVMNGIYFLNILNASNWRKVYECAKRLYEADAGFLEKREAEFAKHAWFENYLFSSAFISAGCDKYIPIMHPLSEHVHGV